MNSKIMPHHLQQPLPRPASANKANAGKSASFQDVLSDKLNSPLKISKHAEKRIQERGIVVPEQMWQEMNQKVKEARNKGVEDSIVLTKNAAFVVSAKNETIITAMDREEAASQLFTNIDSAIILKN